MNKIILSSRIVQYFKHVSAEQLTFGLALLNGAKIIQSRVCPGVRPDLTNIYLKMGVGNVGKVA